MSSTEQTFTSTRCIGNAMSRITSSVMPVGTFEAFLGQLTQMKPTRLEHRHQLLELCFKIGAIGDEDVRRVDWRFGRFEQIEAETISGNLVRARSRAFHRTTRACRP